MKSRNRKRKAESGKRQNRSSKIEVWRLHTDVKTTAEKRRIEDRGWKPEDRRPRTEDGEIEC